MRPAVCKENTSFQQVCNGIRVMSTDSDSRPWFVRFCDTFFQEQNIKYMLGVGMLILLGSSLMLVTTHWDSYTPAWQYLILIAYTAAIHLGGQAGYHNLGLRKTGTGLMALTVLLLPLALRGSSLPQTHFFID